MLACGYVVHGHARRARFRRLKDARQRGEYQPSRTAVLRMIAKVRIEAAVLRARTCVATIPRAEHLLLAANAVDDFSRGAPHCKERKARG